MDNDPMASLIGSNKRMWIIQHRPFILEFNEVFGIEATKKQFHFTHDTLERLIATAPPKPYEGKTKANRLERQVIELERQVDLLKTEMDIVREALREENGAIKEVLQGHANFTEDVSERIAMATKAIFKAGLSRVLANVRRLPPAPPLDIASFDINGTAAEMQQRAKKMYHNAHPLGRNNNGK